MDTEDPPRKRLLTNPNPKPSFITVSPESIVSSDSSSDRFARKTRELPNLSDCHSCSVRINVTNPREQLQPLDSMWRIVLLCKKCSKRVKSSEICSYCFSTVINLNDCFKCRDCKRCIHSNCVEKFGSRFEVCIDCWIPDAIASSIRVRSRKIRKKNVESCEQESRVSATESNELSSLLGQEIRKKVVLALKASKNALRKPLVAKNTVRLAKRFLDISKKVAGSFEKESKVAINRSSFRGNDEQLACYSRRRARKKINLVNSSGLDVPLICYSRKRRKGGLRNSASLSAPLMCYSRRRKNGFLNAPLKCYSRRGFSREHDRDCECYICELGKRTDKHVALSSVCLKDSENSIFENECQEDIDKKAHDYLIKYYRKCRPRPSVLVKDSANLNAKDVNEIRVFGNGDKCHEICENRVDKSNRFLLKYKRSSRS